MEHLNFVNLIQSGISAIGILGGILLWLTKSNEFRGISALLFCIALASCINILEESGLTRNIYLISPAFIMLFGPVTYLATKLLIDKKLVKAQYWHLLPFIPCLLFTSFTYEVIAIGTLWRLVYAGLTISLLVKYKHSLDEQRSDADEFSLNWLVWVLAITAAFNFVDLIRLNIQQIIPYQLNILGQAINNIIWLIAAMIIIIKLQVQSQLPKQSTLLTVDTNTTNQTVAEYQSIFTELDSLMRSNKWFLTPRLTLKDISDLTGLQTRDISRAINLIAKKSFNEYVNGYRIEFVCSALKSKTEKNLTYITFDAGFSSKATFNKVFKQVTGITPTEFKSQ